MRRCAWLLVVVLASLSSGACSRTETVVYVVNRASDDISAFTLDRDNGALSPVRGSPFRAGSAPSAIAIGGRTLYVASPFSHAIAAFTIERSGALTEVRGSPFATEPFPASLTIGGGGRVLHVACAMTAHPSASDTGRLVSYAIDPASGTLTRLGSSPGPLGMGPTSVVATSAPGFVYAANVISRNVSALAVDAASGAATEVVGSPFATEATKIEGQGASLPIPAPSIDIPHTPTAIMASASGRIVYVAGYAYALSVPGAMSVARTPGGMTVRSGTTYTVPGSGVLSSVAAYAVDAATGALTPVDGSPWKAGRRPAGIALDPGGRYAWVVNTESNDISGYAVTAGGALVPAARPYDAGDRPVAIAVDPTGAFAYVANSGSNDVSGYRINAAIGTLTPMPKSPFKAGTEPFAIAIAVTGIQ